jgi:drug/metabolite transporter (DMT)-like permease
MARTTSLLDGRHKVPMTGRLYTRAIAPIGFFFSLSLICGNMAYLYLSVAFIQMLKATTPVFVLLATWGLGLDKPNMKLLANVSFIVIGVVLASWGEIAFDLTGFMYQIIGIAFEATRLVMVQRLLTGDLKMDPLVSLYYFAPICAVMNFVMFLGFEAGTVSWADIEHVGLFTLTLNAATALALNVAVVFLVRYLPSSLGLDPADPIQIGKTSSLVLTLCGVLKDILLVAASILIWSTTVTFLQFFGYSIALGGLVYYKLGGDKIKEYAFQLQAESQKNPKIKMAIYAGVAIVFTGLLWFAFGPVYQSAPAETEYASIAI